MTLSPETIKKIIGFVNGRSFEDDYGCMVIHVSAIEDILNNYNLQPNQDTKEQDYFTTKKFEFDDTGFVKKMIKSVTVDGQKYMPMIELDHILSHFAKKEESEDEEIYVIESSDPPFCLLMRFVLNSIRDGNLPEKYINLGEIWVWYIDGKVIRVKVQ